MNVKLQAYSQALMSCRLVSVVYSDMETVCRRGVDHMENLTQGAEQVNADRLVLQPDFVIFHGCLACRW